jgi:hypothetical protein
MDSDDKSPDTRRPSASDIGIRWLKQPRLDLLKVVLALTVGLGLGLILMVPSLDADAPCPIGPLILTLALVLILPVLIPLAVLARRFHNTRIGVRDEWVVVRFPDGNLESGRDRDLHSVKNGFIINNRRVAVGHEAYPLYDKSDVRTLLQPRLANATAMGLREQFIFDWQHNRGVLLAAGVAILLAIAAIIALESDGADNWLEQRLAAMLGPECQPGAGANEEVLPPGD